MAKISNRFWFQLHGWVSLPVWLIFCFVCLTGTIAVLSHELTWLTNPASRATNPDNLPAKPVAELVAKVQQAYPTADVGTVMIFEPYLVNAVIFTDHDKPYAIAYVNQYSGEIQQINEGITFIGFMRSLHGWLLFPWPGSYSVGYYLVSAMALVMLGALVTGLVIYKNFWRSFTQPKIRFNQGKKTVLTDLHRLAGVWSIWFLMVMSATGLWYLVQAIMWHADIDIEPHAPLVTVEQLPAKQQTPPVSFADAMQIAQQRFPDFRPSYLMLPEHNRGMYNLMGGGEHIFYDEQAYNLSINPWTGDIAQEKSPQSMTALQTVMHIADPLHYGTIGGIWTKAIWFLFGLILSGMSVTGFMIWGSRTVKAVRDSRKAAALQEINHGA
ncbi:PepSY-associated TM helix domain-containing protein [Rheinheimera baltica]|uniref:PepSY-associated TM helix domain-containing protein n=1 Tax=Rheinheimera baltica TaxID=67576 RepID=A0ABT9I4E3_9GAMM|nr:PepSY-associated TM helix domain-containing protein [Rheinheimera baltica]MDP5138261.1 PepSY-associated TM helix domain-containing protein [Rheinheimera baltica]MDP5150945.1 PepSY-associated TM helix domain-containing protein [Rheinheimera baltica]